MTAPTSKEGVKRFMADYQARNCTVYRVWVEVRKGVWEKHPTLPAFAFMSVAEIEAAKIAMRTDVRAERGEAVRQVAPVTSPSEIGGQTQPTCDCCGNVLAFSWETWMCDECKRQNDIPVTYGRPAVMPCPIPDERDMDKGEAA